MLTVRYRQESLDEKRARQARKSADEAVGDGLLPCGKQSAFFAGLGIGEKRPTALLKKAKGRASKTVVKDQQWACADLVRFNLAMIRHGLSSKVRSRALNCAMEGREIPPGALDALADYTEMTIQHSLSK